MMFFDVNSPINLDEVYSKSIQELDNFRSNTYLYEEFVTEFNLFASVTQIPTDNELYSFYKKETRIHALYRLLGLPIVSPDGKFFNPGFDPNRELDFIKKDISNSYMQCDTCKKNQIYQEFSTTQNDILNVFKKQNVDTVVLLLSSLKKRNFADYIKDSSIDHFNIKKSDLSYSVEMKDARGNKYLESYKYPDNKLPNLPDTLKETRYRFILPIIPDPRICHVISSEKQVNVPFLLKRGADSTEFKFPAPKIDQICKERFLRSRVEENLTETEKEVSEIVSKFSSIFTNKKYAKADVEAINSLSGISIKNKNKYYFNFIRYSKNLLKILKEKIEGAKLSQQNYNILPVTDVTGPEKFISIKPIYALDEINSENDKLIVIKTRELIIKSIDDSIATLFEEAGSSPVNPTTVLSGSPAPSSSPIDVRKEDNSLQDFNNNRNKSCADMIDSIKYIEYLTGEFSGLGIIDFYVIISALYLIEDGVLVSFLDDAAYERAKYPGLNMNLPERSATAIEAYKKLTETIRTLYLTLDTLYLSLG